MSSKPHSVSSIEMVQPEIDATIQQAEDSLSQFVDNRDNGEPLQNCIDCLNQLRGIFILVEVQGCVLLCQESVALANEVPVGAHEDKNDLLSTLSNAIFVLRRYTEYFGAEQIDRPELLLPVINELRFAIQEKPYPESHFFEFDANNRFDPLEVLSGDLAGKLEDFEHHAKRFRHMFQVGLLDLLKDRNTLIALKLITRSAQGSARLCAGEPLAQLWALAALVAEVVQVQGMEITQARKRLFMRMERYLREMAMAGKVVAAKTAPDSLKKELLYLLALSGDRRESVKEVLKGFSIKALEIDEARMREESRRLFGPGVDVLRSLSKAISEEMAQLKEKLDVFERGGTPNSEDLEFISQGLARLSGTVSMLDLPSIAARCGDLKVTIEQWGDSAQEVSENELLSMANGILTIETAISQFEKTGEEPDLSGSAEALDTGANAYLSEARIVVIEEAQAGLALAKRSVSSYVESQGDKLHLANVAAVMGAIRGGMVMIDQSRVAAIVHACAQCIQKELLDSSQLPEPTLLETLADALASLEYYIESMNFRESRNEELLKLSEQSLRSIGYESGS